MSSGFMLDAQYVRQVPAVPVDSVHGSMALQMLGYKGATRRKPIANTPPPSTASSPPPKKQLKRIITTDANAAPDQCALVVSNLIDIKKSGTPASRDHPNVFVVDLTNVPEEQLTNYDNVKNIYENIQKQLYYHAGAVANETQNRYFKDVILVPIRSSYGSNAYDKFKSLSSQLMVDHGSAWRYPYANNPMNPSTIRDVGGSGNSRELQIGDVYEFENM